MTTSEPLFAVCEFTTLNASFEDDLAAYSAAGAGGIAICELKLEEGREEEQLVAFRASGLTATSCVPAVPSLLPLPKLPGPESPEERVEAIRAGVRRLAPFEPTALVCLTGPAGDLGEDEARKVVVEGLRAVAEEAARHGIPVALEPMSAHFRDDWTLITTLQQAADLANEAGVANVGLVFDTWHLWDTEDVLEHVRRLAPRFPAVHVNDWRANTRHWDDRALPGEGVIDLPRILGALEAGGFDGWYDLEIFSAETYPDSLLALDPVELTRRGRAGFLRAWEARSA